MKCKGSNCRTCKFGALSMKSYPCNKCIAYSNCNNHCDKCKWEPALLQEYADKAIAGCNNRVDNSQKIQEDDKLTVRLLDYTSMKIGAVYSYKDLLFYWDGESLMYGDEGLDIKDWAELKETDSLFQKYAGKKLRMVNP